MCFLLTTLVLVRILILSPYTYNCILSNWNKLHPRDIYIPRVGVAMVCWMMWYCYSFLLGFMCIFELYSSAFSIIWYGYRYHVTLFIGQLHHITFNRTVLSMCVTLLLGFIMCSLTNSLKEFYFIMIVVIIIEIFVAIIFILSHIFRFSVTK